jgi:hypothetical protein
LNDCHFELTNHIDGLVQGNQPISNCSTFLISLQLVDIIDPDFIGDENYLRMAPFLNEWVYTAPKSYFQVLMVSAGKPNERTGASSEPHTFPTMLSTLTGEIGATSLRLPNESSHVTWQGTKSTEFGAVEPWRLWN